MKKYQTILIFFAAFIVLFGILLIRPINTDEPYYTASANELIHGKLPYTDFLFNQMPFMLFIYSFISGFGFWSLIAGRILSIIFFLFSVYVLYKSVLFPQQQKNKIIFFFVLIFFNAFLINWILVIKTYALGILLLSISIALIYKYYSGKKNYMLLFGAGFLQSCLVQTRIIYLVNLAVFVLLVLYFASKEEKGRIKIILFAGGGIIIPFLFMLWFFKGNMNDLYLNVIRYNYLYKNDYQESYIHDFIKMLYILIAPQNLLLIILILFSGFKYSLFEVFIALNILIFIIAHLFTQMYAEYLVPVLPLMALLVIIRFEKIVQNLRRFSGVFAKINSAKAVIIFYIIAIPFCIPDLKHLLQGEKPVLNPLQLSVISNQINNTEGKTILSSWEAYSSYSDKISITPNGYISFFYGFIIPQLEKKDRDKISTKSNFLNEILNKKADIIVYENSDPNHLAGLESMVKQNYSKVFSYRGVDVYKKLNL